MESKSDRRVVWLHHFARGLALVWAVWWTFFGLASGIGEELSGVGIFIHTAIPGLIFLVTVAVASQREALGSVLLILEGSIVFVLYILLTYDRFPLLTIIPVLLMLALPPLAAGGLCLYCMRRLGTLPSHSNT